MATTAEKCRKTRIVRVYDGKYWADLEVVKNASYKGAQWPGPDSGNLTQETIFKPSSNFTGNKGDDTVTLKTMARSDGGEIIDGPVITIHTKRATVLATRGANVCRSFSNSHKNSCRQILKRRVQANNIGAEYLDGDRQPPQDPQKYKDAVKESKDPIGLWVDIEIPQKVQMSRGKALKRQEVSFQKTWGNGNVDLPGAGDKTESQSPHVRFDPNQVLVNFGPDTLAVQFYDGSL